MLEDIRNRLINCHIDSKEEEYILLTCQEAFKAIEMGNFGIGAALVDVNGKIVSKGHNKVFSPYFRSDLHAEMVVLNQFEDSLQGTKISLKNYTLYTSLEPCPMCLSRIITAGIGTVIYACEDRDGGMVNRIDNLPPVWKHFSTFQHFREGNISNELYNISKDIFQFNVTSLDKELEN